MSKSGTVNFPITVQKLTVWTVSLPLFGFVFCILWSFLFDYESSTKTHCDVANFAPSISAAIGSYLPQKYVWQICISIHLAPRFVFLMMYRSFYQARLVLIPKVKHLISLATLFNTIELLSLLGLTLISSQENFDIHKVCFVTFGIASLIYFVITCFLWTKCGLEIRLKSEQASKDIKLTVVKVFFGFGFVMSYFYYVHNEYCYPYVYSFFCICEYVIVLANMAFHLTAYYDFADASLLIPSALAKDYQPLKDVVTRPF